MLRRRVGVGLACVLVWSLVTCPAVAAHAATGQVAGSGDVQVVDLPSEVRAQPRWMNLIGRTDDGHLVFEREQDPAGTFLGLSDPMMAAPDGSTQVLDARVGGVVGNRLVQAVQDWSVPVTVTSRLVDDTSWGTLTVPDGARYLDYTRDGILIVSGDAGSRQLSLLPWNGDPAVPVAGLPAGGDAWATGGHVGNGSDTVFWASSPSSSGNVAMVVDTARLQAWTVDPQEPACDLELSQTWTINDGVLAWRDVDSSGNPVICTTPLPAAGADAFGPTTSRPGATLAGVDNAAYRLMPVGDDVLVSMWHATPTWGTEDIPIVAVGPDGTERTLAEWGYGVVPGPSGHVIAVTGTAPGQESVRDIEVSSGDTEEVLPVAPVGAWYAGIAVDGDRVVYADDSANSGGVRQRTLDFGDGTASASTLLDTGATGWVAAGAGATAWSKSGWQDVYSAHLSSSGTLTHSDGAWALQTDDRWVLHGGNVLEDTTTGVLHSTMSTADGLTLQDGVTYAGGRSVPGGPPGSVILTDAATGQAAAMPIAGCATVYGAQAAGSWLLVSCQDTGGSNTSMVIDRTGATAQWRIDDTRTLLLGNGFVVARASNGDLSWSPLSDGAATWQPLGTASADNPESSDPTVGRSVAVSRGDTPTVAWFSGRSAHAALLPVATTPLPPHPTGVLPPSAPVVNLVAVDGGIRVYWAKPPSSDAVTRYRVTATATNPMTRTNSASKQVAGTATSTTLLGLTNGASYNVDVGAWNIAGYTDSAPVRATPVLPPSAPTNVQVQVNPSTSTATVTWDFTAAPGTEPVRAFSVWTGSPGNPVVWDLPTDARTATFTAAEAWTGTVSVHAEGVAQDGVAGVDQVSFPGLDTVAPTATLKVPAAVVLSHSFAVVLGASDDRQLAAGPVDVRWRTAGRGQRLGAWTSPPAWQGLPTGPLAISGLVDGQTVCLSARAHDPAGNVSSWTSEQCVAVALDDGAMTRSSGTKRLTGSGYFRLKATKLGDRSTSVRLTGLRANTGWLIASTCPTCGRVNVFVRSIFYGVVNLRSTTVRNRQVLRLPIPAGLPATGTLRLRPTRTGPRVVIDGLALLAH